MSFWRKLVQKFQPQQGEPVDWEALLIEADFGLDLTSKWVREIERQGLDRNPEEARLWLREEVERLTAFAPLVPVKESPEVILLVGVNGSGKTTTTAKLAHQAIQRGRKVVLGAADTFRAAAVDQLQAWGQKLNIPVITGPDGSDPSSVAYRALAEARQSGADLLIIDTAGRMPNKNNLMLEIAKVKRTVQKQWEKAPHRIWLVVDGTTGSNILAQTREFHAAIGVQGLIMTKLDGSAQGGMVAAVRAETGIPTLLIGRGEEPDDLKPFDPVRYAHEIFTD